MNGTPDFIQPEPSSGSGSQTSEESVEFLQYRVGIFGLVYGGFSGAFFLYRLVLIAVIQRWDELNTSLASHAAAVLFSLGIWVFCKGPTRSLRTVRVIDAFGVLVPGALYTAMMVDVPLLFNPEMLTIAALTLCCFGRAIYVPSTAKRTFWLTMVIGLGVIGDTYYHWLTRFDEVRSAYSLLYEEPVVAAQIAPVKLGFAAAWWAMTTGMATLGSHVVYGLRADLNSVRKLGQYTLERRLGSGGMGVVYQANHAMLRRPTAIKLLRPDQTGEASLARFEREVQLTARLSHPNTVTVFDYGRTPDGVFYYAMEMLDGATLAEVVAADGPQSEARILRVLDAVSGSLAEAHGVGLIHRDIKPQNIMLCRHGGRSDVAKVLDFGLVKDVSTTEGGTLTNTEVVTGTPQYLSPEGLTSPEAVDGRADIYALGAVTYFLLTGEPVFTGNTLVEICGHHLHTIPDPPSRRLGRGVDPALESLILSCLEKKAEDRPQSVRELQQAVRSCAQFGQWTDVEAEVWWERRGEELVSRRDSARSSSGDQTIAVDLARNDAHSV